MSLRSLSIATALLVWTILITHLIGVHFSLYWTLSWFDLLLHTLGGLFLSLVTALFFRRRSGAFPSRSVFLRTLILATLLVGIGWEVFEYALDVAFAGKHYAVDTTTDLLADFAGALLGFLFLRRRLLNPGLAPEPA